MRPLCVSDNGGVPLRLTIEDVRVVERGFKEDPGKSMKLKNRGLRTEGTFTEEYFMSLDDEHKLAFIKAAALHAQNIVKKYSLEEYPK